MIWGDQHDQSFFDFFLEKNLLGYFLRIMVSAPPLRIPLRIPLTSRAGAAR